MTLVHVHPSDTVPAAPASEPEAALPLRGDGRFTLRHLWDQLGHPVRVTHTATGLHADLPVRSRFADVTPGRAVALIAGRALDVLHSHVSDRSDRAVAITAVHELQAITSYCVCGGLLHYGIGGVWRHLNVCDDCLTDPSQCWASVDRRHHKGCATPAPAQCEHSGCRKANTYDDSNGCGCGLRSCGNHDCDTAMPAAERAARVDPLDGCTFQIIPTPRVPELRFERLGVLTDSQWAIVAPPKGDA